MGMGGGGGMGMGGMGRPVMRSAGQPFMGGGGPPMGGESDVLMCVSFEILFLIPYSFGIPSGQVSDHPTRDSLHLEAAHRAAATPRSTLRRLKMHSVHLPPTALPHPHGHHTVDLESELGRCRIVLLNKPRARQDRATRMRRLGLRMVDHLLSIPSE